ncbi:polysaccharide biosynthesis C-terminal domain-containing protein [Clostridium perfringens]|nr:polysaccharide biosynthesis C-terminal domain-containing protein [Clostridium perfringens]
MDAQNKRKLILNTWLGIVGQLVTIMSGFIIPRLILSNYGSEVNGLVSSITQFLSFISLMELGIGAVVQSTLYKPLSTNDNEEISKIVKSSQKFFNKIILVFIVYLFIITIIYPTINRRFGWLYTISLIIILAITLILQYFFGMTYQLLLFADQKSYVVQIISIGVLVLYTILNVILIKNGASIHMLKFLSMIVLIIRPISINIYAKHNYSINKKIILEEEPIKQKWNGIAQHIAYFVVNNTDIVVLTIFSTLSNVSIYSIYNLVVIGVKQLICSSVSGIQSLFGNMLAKNENEILSKSFLYFEWGMHTIVTLIFSVTAILIVPFVKVYTNGVTDVNYIQPIFGVLLTFSAAAYCIRIPYNTMVLAAGHYKETQSSAIIEMCINIIISIALVLKLGLVGVVIGTLIAMIYRTTYLARYISNNIIEYKFNSFIKNIVIDLLTVIIIFLVFSKVKLVSINYISCFYLAIKVFLGSITIAIVINFIFYKKYMFNIITILKKRFIN